jgi:hypothetical protein
VREGVERLYQWYLDTVQDEVTEARARPAKVGAAW